MHTVCHIITKLELGGAQQNTLYTVSHLDKTKFHPVLITGEPGLLDEEAKALAGEAFFQVPSMVRAIHPCKDLLAFWKLTRILKRLRPAIVHTHSSKAGVLGRMAAHFTGVPVIIHSIHGYGMTPAQHPLLRRMLLSVERLVARKTTRFFAVSEANRRQGIEWKLFQSDRCGVIRSGVDLDALRRTSVDRLAKRRELGLDPLRSVIGMVAPLKPQKAPLDFVKMAAKVRQANTSVQFILVGDGELRSEVEQESQRLGLNSAFHLLGWRRDVAEILRCLDVFVLTSRWEGLPRVYLEALATGVPIVGTRVDGAEEVVKDGQNGFLLNPGDVDGLAAKVCEFLARGPVAWSRDTDLGKEFDIKEMVRRQEEEYERLIDSVSRSLPSTPGRSVRSIV
ncbi:MAG TPA: glycosyltransferase family 4 protein [Nitrospira sp.]